MDNWITMDNKKNVFIGSTPCYAADTASLHVSYRVMNGSAFSIIKHCETLDRHVILPSIHTLGK